MCAVWDGDMRPSGNSITTSSSPGVKEKGGASHAQPLGHTSSMQLHGLFPGHLCALDVSPPSHHGIPEFER